MTPDLNHQTHHCYMLGKQNDFSSLLVLV